MRLCLILCITLFFALFGAPAPVLSASAYEAELPKALSSSKNICDVLDCSAVVPHAGAFSAGDGAFRHAIAWRHADQKEKVGFVVLSTDVTDLPAYSGKPVVTLIGFDAQGVFTGIKVLKHSEPILLLGIPEQRLIDFVDQYLGKRLDQNIEVGASTRKDDVSIDAITGATVTVIAENQVIRRAARAIARQHGLIPKQERAAAQWQTRAPYTRWADLLRDEAIGHLHVPANALGVDTHGKPVLDLYFGSLDHPAIGKAVLGESAWTRLHESLAPNEHLLFMVANGQESFKGSGFVRGGIYDRIRIAQGDDAYAFRDRDYTPLYRIALPDAPAFAETALYILRDEGFSNAWPWRFVFLANHMDKDSGERSFVNFEREFWMPEHLLKDGRPEIASDATWKNIWKDRAPSIVAFSLLLISVALVYASRDRLVRKATRLNKTPVSAFKYSAWLISIGFAGFYLMAQPSITHILTWVHSLVFEWRWELFLSDPFIFIFWWFIFLSVLLWGRGLFCGWLCPFGSLSELLYKIASFSPLKKYQFSLPKPVHDKLKWGKYLIFFALLSISFHSMALAEQLAEIEPFKTTFLVGVWNRSWPFVLFWGVLMSLSLFMERPFCKYLCPLGAGLALPTQFRLFGLKRKSECQTCTACAKGCGSLAINKQGVIDQRECLLCLDCMVMYYDAHACPPLAQERKRRERLGVPLTGIDAAGYFIPVQNLATEAATSSAKEKA